MEEITKILKNLMSFKTIDGRSLEFDKLFEYIKSILPNNLYQTMYEFNNKKSLVISNSESKNLDLIICTHIDVVYGDDETMKYKEDETNIYGRGAIDMKGQVAVILSLIKNNTFNTKYAVFITSDEEIDGNCCKELMKIYNSKLAIVPDGGNHFELIEEEKGLIQLKLTANTISAHASTPFDGENAILKLLNVYNKLIKKYPLPVSEEDYKTSINLSKINGGDSINKVPDNATMYLDIRYTSDVTLEGILFKTDINNKLIKKYIQTCEEVLNRKIVVKKVTSTSDGIYFSEKNIPTIIMNPSGGNAHSQNEYVNIDSLKKLYEIFEKFIKKEEII